jgi:hypothetical protein
MKLLFSFIKFLLFAIFATAFTVFLVIMFAIGGLTLFLLGRRPQFRIYRSGSISPDMFERGPMKDVTPRPAGQLTD